MTKRPKRKVVKASHAVRTLRLYAPLRLDLNLSPAYARLFLEVLRKGARTPYPRSKDHVEISADCQVRFVVTRDDRDLMICLLEETLTPIVKRKRKKK